MQMLLFKKKPNKLQPPTHPQPQTFQTVEFSSLLNFFFSKTTKSFYFLIFSSFKNKNHGSPQ